MALALLVT